MLNLIDEYYKQHKQIILNTKIINKGKGNAGKVVPVL